LPIATDVIGDAEIERMTLVKDVRLCFSTFLTGAIGASVAMRCIRSASLPLLSAKAALSKTNAVTVSAARLITPTSGICPLHGDHRRD
jgi:hypothetical protein